MKSADKEKMGAYLKKLIEERYPSHRKFGKAYLFIFSLSSVVKIVVNTSMRLNAEPLILQYLWTHERTSSL